MIDIYHGPKNVEMSAVSQIWSAYCNGQEDCEALATLRTADSETLEHSAAAIYEMHGVRLLWLGLCLH